MKSFLLPPEMLIILLPLDYGITMSPPFDSSLAIMISPYCGIYCGFSMYVSPSP